MDEPNRSSVLTWLFPDYWLAPKIFAPRKVLCAIAQKERQKNSSLCVSSKVITFYRQEIALINSC